MWKRAFCQAVKDVFRPFPRSGTGFDLWDVVGVLGPTLSLPALPIAAMAIQGNIPGVKNLYTWAFPLIVFGSLLLVFAFIGLVQARHRILDFDTAELEIVFDEQLDACKMTERVKTADGSDLIHWVLWRVGVRSKGRDIDDVELRLDKFVPHGAEFLPQVLHRMAALLPFGNLPEAKFRASRNSTEYIDVVRWAPSAAPDSRFHWVYNLFNLPTPSPEGDYRITLTVTCPRY